MKKLASIFLISLIALGSVFAQEKIVAVALQSDTALWNEKEPGMMEWAKKDLEPGTVLEVYAGSRWDSQGRKLPDLITSSWTTAKNAGQTLDFIKASYQGNDYYVIASRVALYQRPAVVTKNAATYLTPNLADVRKTALSYGTIVAIGKQIPVHGINLYEMTYYDENLYRLRVGYIKSAKVSEAKDDITAMKLIKQAKGLKDEKRKAAMLDSINQLSITQAVQEILDSLNAEPESPADSYKGSTVMLDKGDSARVISSDDGSNINVRNAPVTGTVVNQLTDGTNVTATMRTEEVFSIDDSENYWYYIDDGNGTVGWVFGSYCPLRAEW
ncbi:MAG: SH3 domain-containing protein [Treponema sp.]|nr:SH3 domain-containing protein [Treponema sp.]